MGVGDRAVFVDAAPTGDGPADEAECNQWANYINDDIRTLTDALDRNGAAVEYLTGLSDFLEETVDMAMDRGCFIVH